MRVDDFQNILYTWGGLQRATTRKRRQFMRACIHEIEGYLGHDFENPYHYLCRLLDGDMSETQFRLWINRDDLRTLWSTSQSHHISVDVPAEATFRANRSVYLATAKVRGEHSPCMGSVIACAGNVVRAMLAARVIRSHGKTKSSGECRDRFIHTYLDDLEFPGTVAELGICSRQRTLPATASMLDRTVDFDPAWRLWNDQTVVHLAKQAERELLWQEGTSFSILADAMEEAGCQEEPILAHLRTPRLHVHGCFALDLILGRR